MRGAQCSFNVLKYRLWAGAVLLSLQGLLTLTASKPVTVRSYNKVEFYEFNTLDDMKRSYFNGDGGAATSNVLLGNHIVLLYLTFN